MKPDLNKVQPQNSMEEMDLYFDFDACTNDIPMDEDDVIFPQVVTSNHQPSPRQSSPSPVSEESSTPFDSTPGILSPGRVPRNDLNTPFTSQRDEEDSSEPIALLDFGSYANALLGVYEGLTEWPFPYIPPQNSLSNPAGPSNEAQQPARPPVAAEHAQVENGQEDQNMPEVEEEEILASEHETSNDDSMDAEPTSSSSAHPVGLSSLLPSQPTHAQVQQPTQTITVPTTSQPIRDRDHPRASTIPGMTPGRRRCDTCYDRHALCDHTPDGFLDPVLAARPRSKAPKAKKGHAKKPRRAKKPKSKSKSK